MAIKIALIYVQLEILQFLRENTINSEYIEEKEKNQITGIYFKLNKLNRRIFPALSKNYYNCYHDPSSIYNI